MNYNTIFPKNQEKSGSYKRRNEKNKKRDKQSKSPAAMLLLNPGSDIFFHGFRLKGVDFMTGCPVSLFLITNLSQSCCFFLKSVIKYTYHDDQDDTG
jgi:hypothetical protein